MFVCLSWRCTKRQTRLLLRWWLNEASPCLEVCVVHSLVVVLVVGVQHVVTRLTVLGGREVAAVCPYLKWFLVEAKRFIFRRGKDPDAIQSNKVWICKTDRGVSTASNRHLALLKWEKRSVKTVTRCQRTAEMRRVM